MFNAWCFKTGTSRRFYRTSNPTSSNECLARPTSHSIDVEEYKSLFQSTGRPSPNKRERIVAEVIRGLKVVGEAEEESRKVDNSSINNTNE
jgi:hypothetical protein